MLKCLLATPRIEGAKISQIPPTVSRPTLGRNLKGTVLHPHFCDHAILAATMTETTELQTQGISFWEFCGKGCSFESIKDIVEKRDISMKIHKEFDFC